MHGALWKSDVDVRGQRGNHYIQGPIEKVCRLRNWPVVAGLVILITELLTAITSFDTKSIVVLFIASSPFMNRSEIPFGDFSSRSE